MAAINNTEIHNADSDEVSKDTSLCLTKYLKTILHCRSLIIYYLQEIYFAITHEPNAR